MIYTESYRRKEGNKMKKIILFLLFAFTAFPLLAQVEFSQDNIKIENRPRYYQDFLNYNSDRPGKTRLDVFIQVPYSEIQFVRNGNGFVSNYFVTISIFDESKQNLIQEKTWNEKIEAKDFDQTTSKNNFNLSLKSFYLAPDKYFIKTSVEDRDSKKEFTAANFYTVKDFDKPFAVSDIMLIASRTEDENNNKIIPNVSRNVAAQKNGVDFFYEVYSDTNQTVNIEYIITDKDDNVIFKDSESKDVTKGRNQFFHTLADTNLSLGKYLLTLKIKNSDDDDLASVTKSFISRWEGVPSSINDLDLAIAQLVYIASTSELDYIKNGKTQTEKTKRYLEFWKKKDPTPNTDDNPVFDEYYRRISYANERFTHYMAGWKTDRGMVFILLGAPNNVDRHPYDMGSKPYEIWEYYTLNKSFIFMDQTGFGDYRLITPLQGDEYRYRY